MLDCSFEAMVSKGRREVKQDAGEERREKRVFIVLTRYFRKERGKEAQLPERSGGRGKKRSQLPLALLLRSLPTFAFLYRVLLCFFYCVCNFF